MAGEKSKDKPKIHLIPSEAILGMASAFTHGIEKHGRYEFRDNNLTYTEIIDALMRHTLAFLAGEDIDEESGLPHTYCIGANYAMLEWKRVHQPELDDRYKGDEISKEHRDAVKIVNEVKQSSMRGRKKMTR